MAIVETGVLTGYVADNVNELQSQSGAVMRVDSSESKIVLYLDEVRIYVTSNVCCVSVESVLIFMKTLSYTSADFTIFGCSARKESCSAYRTHFA